MTRKDDNNAPISATKFMNTLWSYKRGSISRRQFLGTTGLGTAMAVMTTSCQAGRMLLVTWVTS